MSKDPRFNAEGYFDPTAFHGTKNVVKQEKHDDDRVNFLIRVIKFICHESGFEVRGRIVLRDIKTGKEYR